MENCGKIVSNSSSISIINPLDVINRSVEEAQSPGPSTILVAYFDGHAQVYFVFYTPGDLVFYLGHG